MLQQPQAEDMARRLEETIQRVKLARELGFHFVGMGQHYLTHPYQMLQTVPAMAHLAAAVPGMGLLAVTLLPLHNPVDIAEQYATLDTLTGGKVILAAALGYRDEEYSAFGVERRSRVSRFTEGLEVLRRLWTGEAVTFHGRHFHLDNARLGLRPLQRPHPPIWIAANSDAAVQRAGRLGYPWYVNPHAAFPTIQRQVELYRRACQEADITPPAGLPMGREMYVARDRETALQEAGPFIMGKYGTYAAWGQDRALPGQESFQVSLQELARDRFIIGSPKDCISEIRRYQGLGLSHLNLRMQWPGMPPDKAEQSMRLFARAVMPHFTS